MQILAKSIARKIHTEIETFLSPVAPEIISAFRISLGVVTLLNLLIWLPDVPLLFGDSGLFPSKFIQSTIPSSLWSLLYYCNSDLGVWSLYGLFFLATLGFIVGFYSRYCAILCWVLSISFHNRLPVIWNGPLNLISIGFFYSLFLRMDDVFSIRSSTYKPVSGWPIRMLRFQIVLIYFFTGLFKIQKSQGWLSGTYLFHVLSCPLFMTLDMRWLKSYPFIALGMNWVSILFELSFPYLVWFARTRLAILSAGLIFHIGIAILMNVDFFSETILAFYILFLRKEEIIKMKTFFQSAFKNISKWILEKKSQVQLKYKKLAKILVLGVMGILCLETMELLRSAQEGHSLKPVSIHNASLMSVYKQHLSFEFEFLCGKDFLKNVDVKELLLSKKVSAFRAERITENLTKIPWLRGMLAQEILQKYTEPLSCQEKVLASLYLRNENGLQRSMAGDSAQNRRVFLYSNRSGISYWP